VSLGFLSPSPDALCRSPMERQALAAGASFEQRDGWNVAVRFDGPDAERERARSTVAFADLSHIGKVELQAPAEAIEEIAGAELELGVAAVAAGSGFGGDGSAAAAAGNGAAPGTWWCPYTATRALGLCEPTELPALRERLEQSAAGHPELTSVIDLTTAFAALAIEGPLARELFARFTAIDLRDRATPIHGFRPGSVARTPGAILRQADQRWLMLFGAALGQYMWTVVADAAESLGGGPVAADVLTPVAERTEAAPRA
jgi:heterotetrameric sarcosine oxidase gamma subunit